MMRRIIGWSLQARILVIPIAAGLMFVGTAQRRDMPVEKS